MNRYARWLLIGILLTVLSLNGTVPLAQGATIHNGTSLFRRQSVMPQLTNGAPITSSIDILPVHPTIHDSITVVVSGEWSDSCVPYDLTLRTVDDVIMITLITPPWHVVCGQVFTPWSLTAELGTLPRGIYRVQIEDIADSAATIAVDPHLVYLPAVSRD